MNNLKTVLKEESLVELEHMLSTLEVTKHFKNYLRSIRDLHKMCTSSTTKSQNIIIFYAITFGGNISINVNNQ